MAEPDKLKFGLVGLGSISKRHAELIQRHGILSAICDVDLHIAKANAQLFDCRAFSDLKTMLNSPVDLDAIVICTPNYLHAQHTMHALAAGKHVLCEKPMALNSTDCRRMIQKALDSKLILQIVKQNRFNPRVIQLHEMITSGKLGQISSFIVNCSWNRNKAYYHSDWKGMIQKDGGLLFTQFSHFFDIICWVFGMPENISGYSDNYFHKGFTNIEDTGVVVMQFQDGPLGCIHFTTNAFRENYEGSLTVFGENGTVKIGGMYLDTLEYFNAGFSDKTIIEGQQREKINTASSNLHSFVYDEFVESIQMGQMDIEKLNNDVQTVKVVERIYERIR